MENVIACRPGCYELPLPEALAELKRIGIENIEAPAPADGDYWKLAKIARRAGVSISSISCNAAIEEPAGVEKVERAIAGAGQIRVGVIFLSAAAKTPEHEGGIPALRDLAAKAHEAGVVLSLETHPPYAHNGDAARKTIEAVGSPGLGYNFDTANVYFYNPKGTDAVAQLKTALRHVRSVHLKDSGKGEPGSWDFPVLGAGVVDFPEIFRLLGARGFRGPYTMELEGPLVDGLPVEERSAKVEACVAYLRKIGAMGR